LPWRPLPRAHFFCDGTPFGHRIGMLEQVLVGEVVNAHRLVAGKSVSGRHHGNAPRAEPLCVLHPLTGAIALTGIPTSLDRQRVTSV
jgi:hypothetical protein